jgi:hypothetical protein
MQGRRSKQRRALDPSDIVVSNSDSAESNTTESDITENDVAENDIAESDIAENDIAENDIAENDIAESDIASFNTNDIMDDFSDGISFDISGNIHLIGFVPFGVSFEDYVRPLVEELAELEHGVEWIIDGIRYWVVIGMLQNASFKSFIIHILIVCIGIGVYTTDLPQGNDLASVKRHNAEHGCRGCYVSQDNLGDIDFDTVRYGRYHHLTTDLLTRLRLLETQSARNSYASKYGLSLGPLHPLDRLAVNRHTQTPQDPAHVLLQNLTKTLIMGTLDLFNSDGRSRFLMELTNFDYPIYWNRFQNPFLHIKSYFFSDFARLMMIGPFLISKLDTEHFSIGVLDAMKNKMRLPRCTQVVKEILACWIAMASTNALCFSLQVNNYADIDRMLHNLGSVLIKVNIFDCYFF